MKLPIIGAVLALAATPSLAQTAQAERGVVSAGRVAAERTGPIVRGDSGGGITRQDVADHLNQVYRRANQAVENGASPERVRAKVQEHKEMVIRRYQASQN